MVVIDTGTPSTAVLAHEHVTVHKGRRSGLPLIVAVHSTALGPAVGGCRLAHWADWRDGLADALRLSAAMTDKCALAGLPHGGGKTVVVLPPGDAVDVAVRRAARRLAATGARLVTGDIDDRKRRVAAEIGAAWVAPQEVLTADVDVLVPAALGGVLTPHTVPALRCAAIAGPANNQLDRPETAELLHARGIVWAPDYLVGAGGVIHATAVELRDETPARARDRVAAIAGTLTEVLRLARESGGTPAEAAAGLVRRRLAAGPGG